MNLADLRTPAEIEAFVVRSFDDILNVKIGLDVDDSAIDSIFLRKKILTLVKAQSDVSDTMMQLSRVSMEVIKAYNGAKAMFSLEQRRLKDSVEYEAQPREKKTLWLESQTKEHADRLEEWDVTRRLLAEVKETVAQRGQDLKRLDSDLRLYAKLLEARLPGGHAGTGGLPPRGDGHTGEFDIN